jgi:hypothetical protein
LHITVMCISCRINLLPQKNMENWTKILLEALNACDNLDRQLHENDTDSQDLKSILAFLDYKEVIKIQPNIEQHAKMSKVQIDGYKVFAPVCASSLLRQGNQNGIIDLQMIFLHQQH